jgi:mannose-6-phosphate isomerase-like protein (cupin superfamily)
LFVNAIFFEKDIIQGNMVFKKCVKNFIILLKGWLIMIKRANEMITELKHQMRGGNGTVELMHIFSKDELTGKARLFARFTLNKGCSIGLHNHEDEEEIYYILQGKAVVNDNGNISEVTAGDAVLTGNGGYHYIENKEEEPVVMIAAILLFN